jgi:hypothetical protein
MIFYQPFSACDCQSDCKIWHPFKIGSGSNLSVVGTHCTLVKQDLSTGMNILPEKPQSSEYFLINIKYLSFTACYNLYPAPSHFSSFWNTWLNAWNFPLQFLGWNDHALNSNASSWDRNFGELVFWSLNLRTRYVPVRYCVQCEKNYKV